jgi:hypothetical protein
MHTWWTGSWKGLNPVLPPGVHQQNLQRRRQCRSEQEESLSDLTQGDDGKPGNTDTSEQSDADVTDGQKQQTVESGKPSSPQQALATSQIPQNCNKGAQPPWRFKPKRMWSDEDSEAKADQAATETVELVEQAMPSLPGDAAITGSAHNPGHRCQRYFGTYTR